MASDPYQGDGQRGLTTGNINIGGASKEVLDKNLGPLEPTDEGPTFEECEENFQRRHGQKKSQDSDDVGKMD